MDIDVRPCASTEELRDALNVISHYFGHENTDEDAERFAQVDRGRPHARCARRRRGSSAARARSRYRMSVPGGGSVPAGGVTVVGVLPTHRRRGVLTAMMRGAARRLPRARRRGRVPVGVGGDDLRPVRLRPRLAHRRGRRSPRERTRFAQPFEPRGTVRLARPRGGGEAVPAALRAGLRAAPGMFARSRRGGRRAS